MLREPKRLIASIIAIAAGVAFVAATLVLSSSLTATMNKEYSGATIGTSVILSPDQKNQNYNGQLITQQVLDDVAKVPGVTKVRGTSYASVEWSGPKGKQQFLAVPTPELSSETTLVAGRLPAAAGEIAVNEFAATNRSITVGQKLALMSFFEERSEEATVVGIVKPGKDVASGDTPTIFAGTTELARWRGGGEMSYDSVMVYGTGEPEQLRDAIKGLASVKASMALVQTTDDYLAESRKNMAQMMTFVTGFLLAFGVIALVVSALVISNTFSILVAQRTRQLALLRCVGATRAQVFRTVVGESIMMGVAGAVVGVVAGIGLAFGVLQVAKAFQIPIDTFVVPVEAVIVPLVMAVLVTVVASLMPARRATKVMPLAALRPNLTAAAGTRAGRVVIGLGALLLVAGSACLAYGAIKPGATTYDLRHVVIGIVGGLVNFVGVLMLGTVLIPALARVAGVIPAKIAGVAGRLASDNSRRNPARAAATCSALLIGVTLITTVAVGAQSGTATQQAAFDRLFPSDLVITTRDGKISDALITKAKASTSVQSVARTETASVKVGDKQREIAGVVPAMRDVLRNAKALDGLSDTTILVPKDSGIANGTSLSVTGPQGNATLKAVVGGPGGYVVTTATLEKLSGERQQSLWLRLKDGVKASAVTEQLSQDLASDGVSIDGGAIAREGLQQVVNIIVGVVSGLLAVSVLIALIGITNTLGLSVMERTQESGLLRALGLTRGKLRSMFAIEAVILAAVAVVLGIGLGVVYGVAGTYALMRGQATVTIEVPWLILGVIALVALLSGLFASIIPAFRAGQIRPAAALAVGE